MGFESKISGYIASHNSSREGIIEIEKRINNLPNLENDQWPFMPKDIFTVTKPINNATNHIPIYYRSTMIHFALSVKQLDEDLREWIEIF